MPVAAHIDPDSRIVLFRCSGEVVASDLSRKSTVPSPSTVLPGMNLSVAGFGVGSVWMNMGRPPAVGCPNLESF